MKPIIAFITCNALLAVAFILLWCSIAFVDLRVPVLHASSLLQSIYVLSMPLAFAAFVFVTSHAFRHRQSAALLGVVAGIVATPVVYFIGLVAMVNFKLWLGGGL
jgi:hypothetical protein